MKPSVSFARDNDDQLVNSIMLIPSADEYSDRERDAMWYNPQEFDTIRQRCYKEVQLIAQQKQTSQSVVPADNEMGNLDEQVTARGLECISNDGLSIALQQNDSYVLSVLREQDRLRETNENGIVDPEILAVVNQRGSNHRQRMAHLMAMRDADAIRDELDQENLSFSSSSKSSNNNVWNTTSKSVSVPTICSMQERIRRRPRRMRHSVS